MIISDEMVSKQGYIKVIPRTRKPFGCGLLQNITSRLAIDPQQDQRQLTLVQCLTRFAADRGDQTGSPLLIIIEDLHWSAEASLDVLLALAHRVASPTSP